MAEIPEYRGLKNKQKKVNTKLEMQSEDSNYDIQ